MKNKYISKLTILSCLMLTSTIKAQNFYTCVPEENWFKRNYDLLVMEDKFKVAKTQINNDSVWEPVEKNKTSGILSQGIYKVVVKGGDGGNSGDSYKGGDGGDGWADNLKNVAYGDFVCQEGKIHSSAGSSSGSNGGIAKRVFKITTDGTRYEAAFGRKGEDGKDGKEGSGGNGGGKKEKIDLNKCIFSSIFFKRGHVFEYDFVSTFLNVTGAWNNNQGVKQPITGNPIAGRFDTGLDGPKEKQQGSVGDKSLISVGDKGAGIPDYSGSSKQQHIVHCPDNENYMVLGGGGGGGGGGATGGQGGGGAGGYFKVVDIEIKVSGGNGGKPVDAGGGSGGKGRDNTGKLVDGNPECSGRQGGKGGRAEFTSTDGGKGGYGRNVGQNGKDGVGAKGGAGGAGGRCGNCTPSTGTSGANGADGVGGTGGSGGQLMNSDDVSNEGDGYVRIYRYKG